MAPSAHLFIESISPTVLSVGLPDRFNDALCQKVNFRDSFVFRPVSWEIWLKVVRGVEGG